LFTFLNFNFLNLAGRDFPFIMRELTLGYNSTAHDMLIKEEVKIVCRWDLNVLVFVDVF